MINVVTNKFVMLPQSALDDERLSRTDLKVLATLYKFLMRGDEKSVFGTVKMPRKILKNEIGISNDGTYYDSVKKLMKCGYVEREEDIDVLTGRHNATTYTIRKADKISLPYPTVKGGMNDVKYRNSLKKLGYDKKTIDENDVLVIDLQDDANIHFCIANVQHNFRFLKDGDNVEAKDTDEMITLDNYCDGLYKKMLTFNNLFDNPIVENTKTPAQTVKDNADKKVEVTPVKEKAQENKVISIEEKLNENTENTPREMTLEEKLLQNKYAACNVLEYKGIKLTDARVYVNIVYLNHNLSIPFFKFYDEAKMVLQQADKITIPTKKRSRLKVNKKVVQEKAVAVEEKREEKPVQEEALDDDVKDLLGKWKICGNYEIPLKNPTGYGTFTVVNDRRVAIEVAKFVTGKVTIPDLNDTLVINALRDAGYLTA